MTWKRSEITSYSTGYAFAESTVRIIYQRILSLKSTPYLGHPGGRGGTRELALNPLPYIVVYSVKRDAIEILHVYHGAQDWRGV
jgi:toxin ParE1/3/4